MDHTVYEKATGAIMSILSGSEDLSALNTPEGCSAISGHYDYFTQYIVDDAAVSRPHVGQPLPATHTLQPDQDWPIPNVPEGTEVFIEGDSQGVVGTDDLVLSFPLAGVWRVELRPPFPWIGATCEVTVA
ncbi:hypothetical protein [Yoonia sp.]|uniref:hypothetical protein n=1 Tax=Yoonia sp. TaxID=2212373 RepID=UPI002E0077AC|nr:hypothetical protein [Yoonia sp.]